MAREQPGTPFINARSRDALAIAAGGGMHGHRRAGPGSALTAGRLTWQIDSAGETGSAPSLWELRAPSSWRPRSARAHRSPALSWSRATRSQATRSRTSAASTSTWPATGPPSWTWKASGRRSGTRRDLALPGLAPRPRRDRRHQQFLHGRRGHNALTTGNDRHAHDRVDASPVPFAGPVSSAERSKEGERRPGDGKGTQPEEESARVGLEEWVSGVEESRRVPLPEREGPRRS